jgi:tetratricopeptide (TPR) repeat protein
MFHKSLLLAVLCGMLVSAAPSATPENLPQALQVAREQLATAVPDTGACLGLAGDLLRLTDAFPSSSLVPEALYLAARLENACGRVPEACQLAYRLLHDFPQADVAPAAFDLVWNEVTHGGAIPLLGADLARSFADRQESPEAAGPYWLRAFEAYRGAGRWRAAAQVAARYVQDCPSCNLNAPLLLSMAEVSLQAGDMENARRTLEDFLARYPQVAQAVSARVTLASIYQSSGQQDAAHENYSLAWSAFQKHADESAYRQPEVSHAAAQALWILQNEPRREFAQLASITGPFREKQARAQAETLEKTLTTVMLTDEDFAPACFNAIGDVYRQLGDAQLAEGNRRVNTQSGQEPPYAVALPEYSRSAAAYSQAYEKALQEHHHAGQAAHDHPDWHAASVYAAQQACDVTAGQGDAVYGWALELFSRAPHADPGALGSRARFDYLTATVVPLLTEGAAYTTAALDMAARWQIKERSEPARESLDLPLRPVAAELVRIHREQTQEVAATSTQLAKALAFGFQSSSAMKQAGALDATFGQVAGNAARTQTALTSLYSAVTAWQPQSHVFWDSLSATAYYDYAALCRTLQTDLGLALAAFAPVSTDEPAQLAHRRLSKLQTTSATEEYSTLVRWHDWAARCEVKNPLGERLEARLAELDPAYAGTRPDDLPSATRRKP